MVGSGVVGKTNQNPPSPQTVPDPGSPLQAMEGADPLVVGCRHPRRQGVIIMMKQDPLDASG